MVGSRSQGGARRAKRILFLAIFTLVSTLAFVGLLIFGYQCVTNGDREQLLRTGELATAKIMAVNDTGARHNHHPIVDFTLEIHRDGRPPYRTTISQTIPVSQIPQYQPGAMLNVRVDPESPSDVAITGFRRERKKGRPKAAKAAKPAKPEAPTAPTSEKFVTPDALVWTAGPPGFRDGAQFAIIEGHPAKPGPLTIRLELPGGYELPAHAHSVPVRFTVLSGTLNLGTGDELDRATATKLGEGAMAIIPGGMSHFGWAQTDVVIQVQTEGPFQLTAE